MAADLARFAAAEGFEVHVHSVEKTGPGRVYVEDGVHVHTYAASVKLGRATLSFPLLRAASKLRKNRGIAHFHLPYPESGLFGLLYGRSWAKVITYQCDAPQTSVFDRVIAGVLDISHRILIRRADFVATSSQDYADHSRLARLFERVGSRAIPATSFNRAGGQPQFAEPGRRSVGFLGRPTSEKGIDVLLDAMDLLPDDVILMLAGPLEGLSEAVSYNRSKLQHLMDKGRAKSLGFLDDAEIADFYASLDVFVLPSINSFEAFGIVQVEAISAGTPVVTSSLPGVRTIPKATGFGEVTTTGNPAALARGIRQALDASYDRVRAQKVLDETYLSPAPEHAYIEAYKLLAKRFDT